MLPALVGHGDPVWLSCSASVFGVMTNQKFGSCSQLGYGVVVFLQPHRHTLNNFNIRGGDALRHVMVCTEILVI